MTKSKQSRYRNSLDKQVSLEEMKELLMEHAGNVTAISKKIGSSRSAIYNYFDKFPELKDIQRAADERHGDAELDTSYHVLDKLLQNVDENPAVAFQSAKLIVSRHKRSRYFEKDRNESSAGISIEKVVFGSEEKD